MIVDLLDKIEVYKSDNNVVKIRIYLKIGEEIITDYKKGLSHQFYIPNAYDKSRCRVNF